ncbi:MAG: NAD(P)-dependent oxidoreductase [Proteobacteria bacterium]|nr:NAD(P)-dependent oxidoreductase [Pseudomonadota bacterium]
MTLRIAVLGTGLMGAPMAANLLAAGYRVTVWNRTRAKTEPLTARGAVGAGSPAAAVGEAEVVVTMLENGPAVTEVLFDSGAAEALPRGALVIDMSSIPPATARDHAARLEAGGAAHLDAPVSGGTVGAEAGTLAIMAGGARADFDRATGVFAPLGRATYVGPHGAGQLAKLANQIIVGVTIGCVAEALLLAAAGGADPSAVREALRGGFADSRILELHGERMVERRFLPGGRSAIQLKDLETIVATAREHGLELPFSETARALFEALVGRGGGDYDHSALLLELERRNAPARLGDAPDTLPD